MNAVFGAAVQLLPSTWAGAIGTSDGARFGAHHAGGTQMRLATTDLGCETIEREILPQKATCEHCGAQATIRAIFHYFPKGPSTEPANDQSAPQIVMILKCPVCGPQTQVKAAGCAVER
jgi:hypothetical protein